MKESKINLGHHPEEEIARLGVGGGERNRHPRQLPLMPPPCARAESWHRYGYVWAPHGRRAWLRDPAPVGPTQDPSLKGPTRNPSCRTHRGHPGLCGSGELLRDQRIWELDSALISQQGGVWGTQTSLEPPLQPTAVGTRPIVSKCSQHSLGAPGPPWVLPTSFECS